MPPPVLVKPPSVAGAPALRSCRSGCATVTEKPAVSTLAPPAWTLAVVSPWKKLAPPAPARSVPPLKLNVLVPLTSIPPLLTVPVVRVPPLRV